MALRGASVLNSLPRTDGTGIGQLTERPLGQISTRRSSGRRAIETQPPRPDNDGRHFPGPRIDPNTPGEPYQINETNNEPEENLADVTMETYVQDAPASCMSCHHAVSNALGRDFVAFLPGAD